MDTNVVKPPPARRRRRHTEDFKAHVIAACLQPGVSVAAVALANGLNTNLVRLWVKTYRESLVPGPEAESRTEVVADSTTLVPVALQDAGTMETSELRLDLRRGMLISALNCPGIFIEK
jgi:transposase